MTFSGAISIKKSRGLPLLSFVILCLFSLLVSACVGQAGKPSSASQKAQNGSPYTGLWIAPENDKTSFELDLIQNGPWIEGYHAALVGETGNIEAALRTDAGAASLRGRVEADGRAVVKFELRKYKGSGEAILSLSGGRLKWKLISASGEVVLPKSCVLLKQSEGVH